MKFNTCEIYTETIDKIRREKGKVAIFGAGNRGRLTKTALEMQNIPVECFYDNSPMKIGGEFCGLQIKSPNEIQGERVFAIFDATPIPKEVKRQLSTAIPLYPAHYAFVGLDIAEDLFAGAKGVLYRIAVDYNWQIKKDYVDNSIYLLSLSITDRCTLKCKECNSLMPYCTNPIDEDDGQLLALKRLLETVDYSAEISIIGGEPLPSPHLENYIHLLEQFQNYEHILLSTNGTVMPTQRQMEAMRKGKVAVRVSNYGLPSSKCREVCEELRRNHVEARIIDSPAWKKCVDIKDYKRSEAELTQLYQQCLAPCLVFKRGKLFRCPFSASATVFGLIPKYEDDYIDFSAHDFNLLEAKKQFSNWKKRPYYHACGFCYGFTANSPEVPAGVQAKGKLSISENREL